MPRGTGSSGRNRSPGGIVGRRAQGFGRRDGNKQGGFDRGLTGHSEGTPPVAPIPRWCRHRTARCCHGGRHLPGILRRRRALCQRRQARHAHPVGLGPRPAFALPSRPRPAEGADILVLAVGHIAIRKGMGAGRGRGAVGRT